MCSRKGSTVLNFTGHISSITELPIGSQNSNALRRNEKTAIRRGNKECWDVHINDIKSYMSLSLNYFGKNASVQRSPTTAMGLWLHHCHPLQKARWLISRFTWTTSIYGGLYYRFCIALKHFPLQWAAITPQLHAKMIAGAKQKFHRYWDNIEGPNTEPTARFTD